MGSLAFPSTNTPGPLVRAHASRPRNEQSHSDASNTALTMTVSTSSRITGTRQFVCSFLHRQMLHDAPSIGCYGGVEIYAALALGCAQRSAFTLGHTPHNVTPLNVWKEVRLGRGLDPDLRGRARPRRQIAHSLTFRFLAALSSFHDGSLDPKDFRGISRVVLLGSRRKNLGR